MQHDFTAISVVQVGVNFADVFTCLGLYQAAPKENVVPGLEVLMSPALSSYNKKSCALHTVHDAHGS